MAAESGRGSQMAVAVTQSTPEERVAAGKAARKTAPLESHADFRPAKSRDPIALLLSQAESRVPELVPIRHGRMLVSPFAFYRGAALIMAADLSETTTSGLRTQLCGDAHLANFGAYASPERRLLFDLNDFDETLPGPFEYDVKRLAASFTIAGRNNGFRKADARAAATAAVAARRRVESRSWSSLAIPSPPVRHSVVFHSRKWLLLEPCAPAVNVIAAATRNHATGVDSRRRARSSAAAIPASSRSGQHSRTTRARPLR